jgi:hypothetical protein
MENKVTFEGKLNSLMVGQQIEVGDDTLRIGFVDSNEDEGAISYLARKRVRVTIEAIED